MSSPPALSVVIPSRDRRPRLAETLDALAGQELDGELEVIVVDDGSTDDTAAFLADLDPPFRLVRLRQPGRGPAAARNLGIARARAARVLLLGDDTRPAAGCLARHLASADGGLAIQGHVDWDPKQEVTPLMAFLAPAGPQFYFAGLVDGTPIPFTAVLGSNLSAPTAWFRDQPFDEGFPDAALEDTELAFRWQRRGRRAVYAKDALCWHHHRYDRLGPFLDRQRRAGRSARHAVRRHPALLWPVVLAPTLFGFAVRARRWLGRGRPTDTWDLACRRAFVAGFLGLGRRGEHGRQEP